MSELAESYYTRLAEDHQFSSDLPAILRGSPQQLLPLDHELSVLKANPDYATEAKDTYAAIIASLAPLLVACTMVQPEEGRIQRSKYHDETIYSKHLENVVPTLLTPKYLHTGLLSNVQTQAVAPSEIATRVVNRSMPSSNQSKAREAISHWVFLVTSAEYRQRTIVTGLGYAAFLTIVHASATEVPVCNARQFTPGELRSQDLWRPQRQSL
jgi:hypothetical protein